MSHPRRCRSSSRRITQTSCINFTPSCSQMSSSKVLKNVKGHEKSIKKLASSPSLLTGSKNSLLFLSMWAPRTLTLSFRHPLVWSISHSTNSRSGRKLNLFLKEKKQLWRLKVNDHRSGQVLRLKMIMTSGSSLKKMLVREMMMTLQTLIAITTDSLINLNSSY